MRGVSAAPIDEVEAAALLAPLQGLRHVMLAVSGGPDSVAMLGMYARWRKDHAGPEAEVVTIDHGLRAESHAEAEAVVGFSQSLGIAAHRLCWTGPKPATGVQEAAREARYALIAHHAARIGSADVVLAHTLDDQAETVLMRLMRGSGLRGLAGMQPLARRQGLVLHRPLLGVPKARLVATCKAHGWPFVTDPSNENVGFLRPRLRKLMPALAAEGLTAERLARFSQRAGEADRLFDRTAAVLLEGAEPGGMAADRLFSSGPEVAQRVLERMMQGALAGTAFASRRERLEALTVALHRAWGAKAAHSATLAGCMIVLKNGLIQVRPAPARRVREGHNSGHQTRPDGPV